MAEYTGPLVDAPVRAKQRLYTPLNAPQPMPIETATPAVASELTPKPPPAGLTPKALNEYNLAEANRLAAMRIKQQEEEKTGASKAPEAFMAKAQKLKDFEGYLKDYKNEIYKDLTVFPKEIPILPSQGINIPLPVGSDTARINSKYTALLMGIKDAYQLGALTGPDMGLVESQLTNPASISGAMTSRDAMKEQIKVLEGILERGKSNLETSYNKKMDFGSQQGAASSAVNPSAANPANDPLGLRPRRP
jgi:hypothetical protein